MNLIFLCSPPIYFYLFFYLPFIVNLLQSGFQVHTTTKTVAVLSIDICVGISSLDTFQLSSYETPAALT